MIAAFTRTPAGLFKIYDHGQDWQILGPNFERWCSKWAADPDASLQRAISLIPQSGSITYTIDRNKGKTP